MNPLLVFLFASFAASRFLSAALGAEPFLKPNDVIALIGGEDMVAAAEHGYLELLLTRALPDHRLKFRCLAWEGDTVFEQRRDLNFPTWEEQLEKIGATVVICQFGQMESLAGKEKLPQFITAYEKLIARFRSGDKRRVAAALPRRPRRPNSLADHELSEFLEYVQVVGGGSGLHSSQFVLNPLTPIIAYEEFRTGGGATSARFGSAFTNDGFHLSSFGHRIAAYAMARDLLQKYSKPRDFADALEKTEAAEPLRELIVAKNQLWDRYWRVQNWAFLAGDRTAQASSRDHLDPTKRWFPAEREQFLPLIEKKEQEIWALAAKQR